MSFWEQIKEKLEILVLKLLVLISSRKFWAAVAGVIIIASNMNTGVIGLTDGMWQIAVIVSTYIGATAYEDTHPVQQ